MELKPIYWVSTGAGGQGAVVMGVELVVFLDKDGTYTTSCTARNKRPELQKMFKTAEDAKHYAETVLLVRELRQYFTGV